MQHGAPYFRTLGKRRTGGGRGGAFRGECADADWVKRFAEAVGQKYGDGTPIAKALGVERHTVSKLKSRGQGQTDLVFDASRKAGIAPPRRLLDDEQYRLLEALEQLRAAVASMPSKGRAAAVEAAVARFESLIAEYTKPTTTAPDPLGRTGSDG